MSNFEAIFNKIKETDKTIMEDYKKKYAATDGMEKDIVFSKSIKAGKRIYYLDVKKNRKDEMYLAITESKKIVSEEGEMPQVNFEKHKIFLYREDFEKFANGLTEAIQYITDRQGHCAPRENYDPAPNDSTAQSSEDTDKIKIDIDF